MNTWEQLRQQYHRETRQWSKHLGPWGQHQHSLGCSCGLAGKNTIWHGNWWYRETIHGDQIILAEDGDKKAKDEEFLKEGYILHDE